jgi:P27 family predicted phage terminase small subunit
MVLEGKAGTDQVVSEPKPRPVAPRMPRWLSKGGRAVWRSLYRSMESSELLTVVDGPIFGTFCDVFSEALELAAYVRTHGETLTAPSGIEKPRPEAILLRAKRRDALACATELGLTPAARKRMAVLVSAGGAFDATNPSDIRDLVD